MQVAQVNYQNPHAPITFCDSLKNTGFAVITNHPIDLELLQQVYEEWHIFFQSDSKNTYAFNPKTQDGYVSPNLSEVAKGAKVKDLKEFYHLYLPWGRYPSSLSDKTKVLRQQMYNLAKELLIWIENNTPAEIFAGMNCKLSDAIGDEQTLFRILNYPPLAETIEPDAIRAAAHEDINLLTVLPAANEPGLEVKDLQGVWHPVACPPGTVVINAGDMLQECSNHYYISTTHRVVNPTGSDARKARMSLPLFLHAKPEVYLSDKYPQAQLYLDERTRELGLAM